MPICTNVFFASKDADGAKSATKFLIGAVAIAELMIIFAAWVASSMIPDAEVGKYVLIYASHQFLPPLIGAIMMTTIIGIIISTADSFLLVPATTLMRDVYMEYIDTNASETKIVFLSRVLVVILGIIAYFVSLGFAKSSGFFERSLYAYTIYGAAITPSLSQHYFGKKQQKKEPLHHCLRYHHNNSMERINIYRKNNLTSDSLEHRCSYSSHHSFNGIIDCGEHYD
ncbi:hypothetical protein CM15mP37_05200 [bacterium]|nr:MAG: hypothetical protein CM15mP37_05200 [bacterium]